MSNTNFSLAKSAFERWRSSRASRTEPIPEGLWSMALELYPKYKRSHICSALRISGAQFKKRLEHGSTISANHGFVLTSRYESQSKPPASEEMQLTLQGAIRSMTLCFDKHSLGVVLPLVSSLL